MMLNVLHMCFPRFAEKSDHGGFQQQVHLLIKIKKGYILRNFMLMDLLRWQNMYYFMYICVYVNIYVAFLEISCLIYG